MSSTSIATKKPTDIVTDPNDILALQYNKYKSDLYGNALSKPSEYFKLRGDLEDKLKTTLVTNMYKTIYELLRYGCIDSVCVCGKDANAVDRIPGYPSAKVNALSMKITSQFNSFMDEIIEILMPPSYTDLATTKMAVKSEAIGI